MKRLILFALVAALGCSGKSGDKSGNGAESAADADQIKALVPETTGMPVDALKEISAAGVIPQIESLPDHRLTIVLLCLEPGKVDEPARKDFDVATKHLANLAKLMEESADKGYGTLLQARTIKDVTCRVDGDTATGMIRFEAEDICRGNIEYSARKTDKGWQIEEFRLPNYKIKVTRGKDGNWKKS